MQQECDHKFSNNNGASLGTNIDLDVRKSDLPLMDKDNDISSTV